jgi:cell wall assembly regulator SMI1
MNDPWQRILAWVEEHAPDLLDFLEPPADRAELAEAETRLAMRFPTVLRAFYALQNGTTPFAVFPALDADQSAFGPLPLDEIQFLEVDDEDDAPSEEDFEVDPGVRREFWNPGWLPFAAAGDRGDYLMLDLAPARGGRFGQVIEWRHDTNERRLAAASLEALLADVADGMEAGKYVYSRELGVRRVDDA